jgi:hypothetical protein
MDLNNIINRKQRAMRYHNRDKRRCNNMRHYNSKIGKYGIRWQPVESYKRKDGKKVPPHMKKVEFKWKEN